MSTSFNNWMAFFWLTKNDNINKRVAKLSQNDSGSDPQFRVIGAGYGRTGTASLHEGLIKLGFKCYHMKEVILSPEGNELHSQHWITLYQAKNKLKKENKVTSYQNWDLTTLENEKYAKFWKELFDDTGYTASVDWPACMFYLELIEYYKQQGIDYKVILSVRDNAEVWWKSYSSTIGYMVVLMDTWFFRLIPKTKQMQKLLREQFTLSFDEGKILNEKHVINKYDEWIESVKKFVDEDKLLIYNVKQGWKPLCKFLEMEIPKEYAEKPDQFIWSNDSKAMQKKIERIKTINLISNVVLVGIVVCVLALIW